MRNWAEYLLLTQSMSKAVNDRHISKELTRHIYCIHGENAHSHFIQNLQNQVWHSKTLSNDAVLVILCIRQYILVTDSTDPVRLPISHVEGITKCIGTGTVNTKIVVSQENNLKITCQHSHCSPALCEGESPGSKASSSIHCSTSLVT